MGQLAYAENEGDDEGLDDEGDEHEAKQGELAANIVLLEHLLRRAIEDKDEED